MWGARGPVGDHRVGNLGLRLRVERECKPIVDAGQAGNSAGGKHHLVNHATIIVVLYRECLSQHICVRVYLGVGKRSVEAKCSRPAKTQRFVIEQVPEVGGVKKETDAERKQRLFAGLGEAKKETDAERKQRLFAGLGEAKKESGAERKQRLTKMFGGL